MSSELLLPGRRAGRMAGWPTLKFEQVKKESARLNDRWEMLAEV
ncbi:hypothetical protein [Hymenobacter psychrophilus]|nr:hypothetical protein [Hymenobacter psychrophilus]